MPDLPGVISAPPVIGTANGRSMGLGANLAAGNAVVSASSVWPAANRALYMPFEIHDVCTAYQIAFVVGVQSGNLDVGIYDEVKNRLVSAGSTAVGAAGVQVVNITDTVLTPGCYFLAMCVDNITAAFQAVTGGITALALQTFGVQQQAVGAVTLPDPATFANPASAYLPPMYVSTMLSTI